MACGMEWKKAKGEGLQLLRQKSAAFRSTVACEAALAPVEVAGGGLSAVFQHSENNHRILTNPLDLCLISKTLLML